MYTRPTSVAVIAWILIISGAIALIATTAMTNNQITRDLMQKSPIPIPIQYAMNYLGLLISIISGIGILKGCNWARYLYVIWGGIGFIIGVATSPMKAAMLPGVVLLGVFAFFLFRPTANKYFSNIGATNDAQSI